MKKFLIIIVIGAVGIYGAIAILRGPAREFTESLLKDTTPAETSTWGPSFTDDGDRDGLSDAKENIYGTSPTKYDTDGDGFSDGEEVSKGFDPTVSGEARIEDNEEMMANLTVRYFIWARNIAGVDNPQLNDDAVDTFLSTSGLGELIVPTISDDEMVFGQDDSREAIMTYLSELAKIELPDATASYIDLADEVIREKQSSLLDTVISGLDDVYQKIAAVSVPPQFQETHRLQLSYMKGLRNLFVDLYSIERDPVLLVRGIAWGNTLLLRSLDVEKERRLISSEILPDPTNEQVE